VKNILLVGGYDPTNGAGITQDIKTVKLLGENPLSVITSIIPQNNLKVYSKMDIPKNELLNQFKSIFDEYNIDVVKTGVLTVDAIDILLKYYKKYKFKIVCDPVLKSTTNYNFSNDELLNKYGELFKISYIITPNREEYNIISNIIKTDNVKYTLITGTDDNLYHYGNKIYTFKGYKIDKEVHGTGCVFSSSIGTFLCKGYDIVESVKKSKDVVLHSIIYSTKTKYGYNCNPTYITKDEVIKNLHTALYHLKKMDNFHKLIPEVGSNIAESLPLPKDYRDIAALSGRIIKNKLKDSFYIVGEVEFGTSKHISNIILSASKHDPKIRSCINIKYSENILYHIKDIFKVSSFNRKDEPPNVSSMEWGTDFACKTFGGVPDIIYDKGDVGKEPMIRILGENSLDVVKKVKEICKLIN